MRRQLDSLTALRRLDVGAERNYVRMEKERLWLLVGAAGLMFIALLYSNFRSNDRWRKLLEKKELEWDIMRSNLQYEAEMKHNADFVEATSVAVPLSAVTLTSPDPYTMYHGPKPEAIACLQALGGFLVHARRGSRQPDVCLSRIQSDAVPL